MLPIPFGSEYCQNIASSIQDEWLETNGLGDYASSTIPCCNTRKYHGLLVANLQQPEGRHVLLSTLEESLVGKTRELYISCRRHPNVYHPTGWEYLEQMQATPWPAFHFRFGDYQLIREVLMPYKQRVTLFRYTLHGPARDEPLKLLIKPLLAFRHFHALTRANLALNTKTFPVQNGFVVQPYDALPPLYMQVSSQHVYYPSPDWCYNVRYQVEAERGFDHEEDLFLPACIEAEMLPNKSIIVSASTQAIAEPLNDLWEAEAKRRKNRQVAVAKSVKNSALLGHLSEAGEAFIITTPDTSPAILAGYHWFDAWGRDSLIALPGLTFCTGRAQQGKELLQTIGASARQGLIPNCYRLNAKDHAYNSVDASLWYAWAVQQMLVWTRGNTEFVREVCWPVIEGIVKAFLSNSVPHVHMDEANMLHVGNAATQLTWMDASVNNIPVTPRGGCPVEINALWYNTLMFAASLRKKYEKNSDKSTEYHQRGTALKEAFRSRFWVNKDNGYLADVWEDGFIDASIRPNQIFAVSMPFSMLNEDQQAAVVHRAKADLLTPFGLRTLSPSSAQFHGIYEGDGASRDGAYHQGIVWPWLLGGYADAMLRVTHDMPGAVASLLQTITPLCAQHIKQAGLGFVSEIFDALPPQNPNGCIAQAWSVAELTRLLRLMQKVAPQEFVSWEAALVKR